jgi:transcriptional regulator with XRE-family HTH domain
MPQTRSDNFIRYYRRKMGLSQDELSFLLGRKSGSHVSRYERGRREPSLETLLAFEVVFQAHLRDLYPGRAQQVEETVRARAGLLLEQLGDDPGKRKRLRALLAALYSNKENLNDEHP